MAGLQFLKKLDSQDDKNSAENRGPQDRKTPLSPMERQRLHEYEELQEQRRNRPPRRFSRR